MKTILLGAAVLGFSMAAAHACPYAKSVKADDKMTVASLERTDQSTRVDASTTASVTSDAADADKK